MYALPAGDVVHHRSRRSESDAKPPGEQSRDGLDGFLDEVISQVRDCCRSDSGAGAL